MKSPKPARVVAIIAMATACAATAQAQVRITEVAPWSSGNSPVAADWFEVTNFEASAVSITGWKMDDNSNSFAASVALLGITSIAAGESVIFIEAASPSTTIATFKSTWFGSNVPAGLQFGSYSGSGVGLSTGGDAVNLFNAAGVLRANVSFGASPTGPYATFDNAAGLDNVMLTKLSAVGVNGAFVAKADALEVGSPGLIATAVPEPETYAMMLSGLVLVGAIARRRKFA